ncbi:hypothetical protein CBR_g49921 [Chara braunii]|uniref:Uncharacterized protein n=1 Tax=Chara braunii TaxID=69332 RepID=A0A388JPF8_CHABU|nr:hypothetical protein CBR_g49921 [Chara braunii]|eukprot:GBG59657.1 hypothetical protein CBR_g49921 [Chara braunii]
MTRSASEAEELARLRREQAETKASTDKRLATLGEVIFTLKKLCEVAESNAEVWRNEALRPGNKRSSVTIGYTPTSEARVRPKVTLAASPSATKRVNLQLKGLVEKHQREVDLLKEMCLPEVDAQKESEDEVERLKEAMVGLGTRKRSKGTPLKANLDDVAGPSSGKDKDKRPASPTGQASQRDVFVREARKQLQNLRKKDVISICEKEGIEYTKLDPTKEVIAQPPTDIAE